MARPPLVRPCVRHGLALATLALLGLGAPAVAAEPVRGLSTDRPDATESPYSVPKGWVQLEMDLLAGARESAGDTEVHTRTLMATNLKFGVTHRADLQVLFEPDVHTTATGFPPGSGIESSGTGTLGVRLKWNWVGNDGGRLAHGVLLSLAGDTRPSLREARWGIAVPVALALGERLGFGAMVEATRAAGESGLLGTATLGMDVTGPFGCFVELTAEHPLGADDARPASTWNMGVTAAVGNDVQLDGGVRLGLSEAADDAAAFIGLAFRRRLR